VKRTAIERHAPLRTNPDKGREFEQRGRANRNQARRPISPASPVQRKRVEGWGCLVCAERPVDPAHVIDRSLTSVGQEHALAVVPLCRKHHDDYDDHRLDLLPYLEADGWRQVLGYAVARFGLVSALERITGERWAPMSVERAA
jgi:hypothetical protein